MNFKRQLYIEDLFVPKKILNAFDWVKFNSCLAFTKARTKMLYDVKEGSIVEIRLKNYQEFNQMKKLFETNPDFFVKMKVLFLIYSKKLLDFILKNNIPKDMKFDLIIVHPIKIADYWQKNRDYLSKNRTVYIQTISYETIAQDICGMLEIFNNNNLRFFKLDIDYESFSKCTLSDLDKVKFWFFHLKTWVRDQTLSKGQKLDIFAKNFYKPIFVDDDLTLYLDSHKESDLWHFPLGDHLKDTGETISNYTLNRLHKYMDLHPQAFYTDYKIINWDLISYRQIKKLGYFINEIPLIMGLIQRWIYI